MNGAALEGYRNGRHTAQGSGHSRTLFEDARGKARGNHHRTGKDDSGTAGPES